MTHRTMSLQDVALKVRGLLDGPPDQLITGVNSLAKAAPGELSFACEARHSRELQRSRAAAALVPQALALLVRPLRRDLALIVVDDPYDAFLELLLDFQPPLPAPPACIHPTAQVSPTARIGEQCRIEAGAVIGDGVILGDRVRIGALAVVGDECRIGDDSMLFPHATLYPRVTLGRRVVVHAHAVLGADGFGYRFRDGRFQKTPQLGTVVVDDDVEIGASTTIDRAMIGATRIGEGTKIDNLVMIGHNCEIGRHNVFASQVGFAGSVTTGDYVRCAGQVGIADHVHLGERSSYGAKAGVHRDMPAGRSYLGAPASDERDQMRTLAALQRIPEMRKQLRELERQVAQLRRMLAIPQGHEAEPAFPADAEAAAAAPQPL
jgi:UDP-3-O-[3-hydroxymyristoyl] glucosamine N-acyltransferase